MKHFLPSIFLLIVKKGNKETDERLAVSRKLKIVQKFSGYVRLFHVKHLYRKKA